LRPLEVLLEERRRFVRDAKDLVRCLTIELEVELSRRLAVVPVVQRFELAPSELPLRVRGSARPKWVVAD